MIGFGLQRRPFRPGPRWDGAESIEGPGTCERDVVGGFMRRMRGRGSHGRNVIAGTAIAGACLFGFAAVHRLWVDSGLGRVVSVQEYEESGDSCYRPAHS